MPTRDVNLTEELDRFVLSRVESVLYENASEVVRAFIRALECEETPVMLSRVTPSPTSGK